MPKFGNALHHKKHIYGILLLLKVAFGVLVLVSLGLGVLSPNVSKFSCD